MYDERMAPALTFEQDVIDRLNSSGWCAAPYGQGVLPVAIRDRLVRFEDSAHRPCALRWTPDIVAVRDFPSGRTMVALIDAKSSMCQTTPNFSIETAALEIANTYADGLHIPTYFVFQNFSVMPARVARQRAFPGPEPDLRRGSGTAYVLINKRWARPFEQFFPPVVGQRQKGDAA